MRRGFRCVEIGVQVMAQDMSPKPAHLILVSLALAVGVLFRLHQYHPDPKLQIHRSRTKIKFPIVVSGFIAVRTAIVATLDERAHAQGTCSNKELLSAVPLLAFTRQTCMAGRQILWCGRGCKLKSCCCGERYPRRGVGSSQLSLAQRSY